MKPSNPQTNTPAGAGRLLPLVRFWHRSLALYHKIELNAAYRRGDMSAALTHAEKELKHIAEPYYEWNQRGKSKMETAKQAARSRERLRSNGIKTFLNL